MLDDALLGGMSPTLTVQATHYESVLRLPPGARRLTAGDRDPNHAFAVGRAAWGLQFHPEFDAELVRYYLRERRQWVLDQGENPDALSSSARDSPHGEEILKRFAQML